MNRNRADLFLNRGYLLKKNLIDGEFIFHVCGRSDAGEGFEIADKVGLIEITAVVGDGG